MKGVRRALLVALSCLVQVVLVASAAVFVLRSVAETPVAHASGYSELCLAGPSMFAGSSATRGCGPCDNWTPPDGTWNVSGGIAVTGYFTGPLGIYSGSGSYFSFTGNAPTLYGGMGDGPSSDATVAGTYAVFTSGSIFTVMDNLQGVVVPKYRFTGTHGMKTLVDNLHVRFGDASTENGAVCNIYANASGATIAANSAVEVGASAEHMVTVTAGKENPKFIGVTTGDRAIATGTSGYACSAGKHTVAASFENAIALGDWLGISGTAGKITVVKSGSIVGVALSTKAANTVGTVEVQLGPRVVQEEGTSWTWSAYNGRQIAGAGTGTFARFKPRADTTVRRCTFTQNIAGVGAGACVYRLDDDGTDVCDVSTVCSDAAGTVTEATCTTDIASNSTVLMEVTVPGANSAGEGNFVCDWVNDRL